MPQYILKTPEGQYQLSANQPESWGIVDFLTKPVAIAGYNIPTWGLIAGGLAVYFFLLRRR